MKVDWVGNAMFKGDVYVHTNADSSGGIKLATVEDIPVKGVLVNGTSVVDNNGNANISIPQQSGPLHVTWNTDDTPNTLSEYFQDIAYAMEHSGVTVAKYETNGDDVSSKYFYVIEANTEIRSGNTAGIVKISNGANAYTFETGNIEAYEPMELVTN